MTETTVNQFIYDRSLKADEVAVKRELLERLRDAEWSTSSGSPFAQAVDDLVAILPPKVDPTLERYAKALHDAEPGMGWRWEYCDQDRYRRMAQAALDAARGSS